MARTTAPSAAAATGLIVAENDIGNGTGDGLTHTDRIRNARSALAHLLRHDRDTLRIALNLPQLVPAPLPFRRTIRRRELRQIVPLADTTIYELERRGEFPRRFSITTRCVVWDLEEVEAWVEERRKASTNTMKQTAPAPDVRQRKHRPVRGDSTP